MKATCINNNRVKEKLTIMKDYEVISEYPNYILRHNKPTTNCIAVECDDNIERVYESSRFIFN